MMLLRLWRNLSGTTAIEFALTAPVFFLLVFGIVEAGRLMWTQVALQHGVEMAARCASLKTADNPNPCPGASIEAYAAAQTLGLQPPLSVFTVATTACGAEVSAAYTYNVVTTALGTPSLSLSARSCVPN